MKRALNGTAKVELRDGSIKGMNLGEIIRKGRSMHGAGWRFHVRGAGAGSPTRRRRPYFT